MFLRLLSLCLFPFLAMAEAPSVARLLVVAVDGPQLDAASQEFLRELQPGGVILLGHNVRGEEQTAALVRAIKATAGRGGADDYPLIYVDQEGGRINRLRLADAPSAQELAARGAAAAQDVGTAYAHAAAARGIAVLLAPVLDLRFPQGNQVIGDRSFGRVPAEVSALAGAFAQGVRAGGALPVLKHFPGHGAAVEDSHHQLARLEVSEADLRDSLAPFEQAARAQAPAIMVGHIAVPALDPAHPNRPATLSAPMLQGLLRKSWGYEGVLISDDMNMKAVQQPLPEACVAAIRAGMDTLIICDANHGRLRAVKRALEEAAASDPAFAARVWESVGRVERMRRLLAP